jgi:23S rRNA (guanosine2251-2'-O)-methyltransferase
MNMKAEDSERFQPTRSPRRKVRKSQDETVPQPYSPAKSIKEESANLYGLIPVLEALRAGRRSIEYIAISEGAHYNRLRELIDLARTARVPVRRVPRSDMQRLLGANVNHQGVVARVASAQYDDAEELLDRLASKVATQNPPLAIVLDSVEDPRNLGAILRTGACAGVDGVFIPERRAVGLNATVAKAAAGALEHLSVARVPNLVRLIDRLKEHNIWTIGSAGDGPVEYTAWDWTLPSAVILGGEGEGLHRLVREHCDIIVRIPVRGKLQSLNVSVAAGILLYEALRQRSAAEKVKG